MLRRLVSRFSWTQKRTRLQAIPRFWKWSSAAQPELPVRRVPRAPMVRRVRRDWPGRKARAARRGPRVRPAHPAPLGLPEPLELQALPVQPVPRAVQVHQERQDLPVRSVLQELPVPKGRGEVRVHQDQPALPAPPAPKARMGHPERLVLQARLPPMCSASIRVLGATRSPIQPRLVFSLRRPAAQLPCRWPPA